MKFSKLLNKIASIQFTTKIIKAKGSTECICEHTSLQNKSNAYINWNTKNIQISKFKGSNFDSKPTTFTTVTMK